MAVKDSLLKEKGEISSFGTVIHSNKIFCICLQNNSSTFRGSTSPSYSFSLTNSFLSLLESQVWRKRFLDTLLRFNPWISFNDDNSKKWSQVKCSLCHTENTFFSPFSHRRSKQINLNPFPFCIHYSHLHPSFLTSSSTHPFPSFQGILSHPKD